MLLKKEFHVLEFFRNSVWKTLRFRVPFKLQRFKAARRPLMPTSYLPTSFSECHKFAILLMRIIISIRQRNQTFTCVRTVYGMVQQADHLS